MYNTLFYVLIFALFFCFWKNAYFCPHICARIRPEYSPLEDHVHLPQWYPWWIQDPLVHRIRKRWSCILITISMVIEVISSIIILSDRGCGGAARAGHQIPAQAGGTDSAVGGDAVLRRRPEQRGGRCARRGRRRHGGSGRGAAGAAVARGPAVAEVRRMLGSSKSMTTSRTGVVSRSIFLFINKRFEQVHYVHLQCSEIHNSTMRQYD